MTRTKQMRRKIYRFQVDKDGDSNDEGERERLLSEEREDMILTLLEKEGMKGEGNKKQRGW